MPFRFSHEDDGLVIPANIDSKEHLLAFLAEAIPLPAYFGHNWDSLEECLGELDWLKRAELVLIHRDVPLNTKTADQRTYLEILADAAKKSERLVVVFPGHCRAHVLRILGEP